MFSNQKILVTNDDGINSLGLKLLLEKLTYYTKEILVVAPNKQMSATSHKLTLHEGINLHKEPDIVQGIKTYSITGTPVDCVNIAVCILNFLPNMIFSGVNDGYNIGTDILYSGTIAAASEAVKYQALGIAFSCDAHTLKGMQYFDEVIKYITDKKLFLDAKVLNVNLPELSMGIKITHQGENPLKNKYTKKLDGLYYINSTSIEDISTFDENSDVYNVKMGYISITPLTNDKTDIEIYKKWQERNI